MNRIIIFSLLFVMALPLTLSAQGKTGHIVLEEILLAMPEYKTAVDSIRKVGQKYSDQADRLQVEINKKYDNLMQMQTAGEVDTLLLQSEFNLMQQMQQNFEDFQTVANEKLTKLQQSLFADLRSKVMETVKIVATELDLVYVFDVSQGNPVYYSEKSVDVGPQVKAKLGIQ